MPPNTLKRDLNQKSQGSVTKLTTPLSRTPIPENGRDSAENSKLSPSSTHLDDVDMLANVRGPLERTAQAIKVPSPEYFCMVHSIFLSLGPHVSPLHPNQHHPQQKTKSHLNPEAEAHLYKRRVRFNCPPLYRTPRAGSRPLREGSRPGRGG